MGGSELLISVLVLGVLAGGVLFFLFRDARRMEKPGAGRRGHRRRAKPGRGAAKPAGNPLFPGTGMT
jgi:hypothetical protein